MNSNIFSYFPHYNSILLFLTTPINSYIYPTNHYFITKATSYFQFITKPAIFPYPLISPQVIHSSLLI